MLGFYNPNPASVVRTVWLDLRSRSAAASVDLHSQERQTPLPTSYSVSQPRFAEASVANALRALATLTAIITRLPLSKIEIINHLQHSLLSNALTPFAFQHSYRVWNGGSNALFLLFFHLPLGMLFLLNLFLKLR